MKICKSSKTSSVHVLSCPAISVVKRELSGMVEVDDPTVSELVKPERNLIETHWTTSSFHLLIKTLHRWPRSCTRDNKPCSSLFSTRR